MISGCAEKECLTTSADTNDVNLGWHMEPSVSDTESESSLSRSTTDDHISDVETLDSEFTSVSNSAKEEEKATWESDWSSEHKSFNIAQRIFDWSTDSWENDHDAPIVQHDSATDIGAWDWEAGVLQAQSFSDSVVLQRLAQMGIPITELGSCESALVSMENRINTKTAIQRGKFLRRKRHERTILIDDPVSLSSLLDRIHSLSHVEPQVVVDSEGLNFRRTGTIDIVELFVIPDEKLFLVDVVALKTATWHLSSNVDANFTLAKFLSSNIYQKIMWDGRMESHILNLIFGIKLAGVIDASLWAVAYRVKTRSGYDGYRLSIETACHEHLSHKIDPAEMASLQRAKEDRRSLPPRPWAIRPLPDVLIDYAADVQHMGMLYYRLKDILGKDEDLVKQIEYYTEQDITIASSWMWNAHGESDPVSPWSSGYLQSAKIGLEFRAEDIAERTTIRARCSRFFKHLLPQALRYDCNLVLELPQLVCHGKV